MSILFEDGCSLYGTNGTVNAASVISRKWSSAVSVGITTNDAGGLALLLDSSNSLIGRSFAPRATMGFCARLKIVLANTTTPTAIVRMVDAGADQLTLVITPSQQLQLTRGGVTALATSVKSFGVGVSFQIEAKFTISDGAGLFELRLNGNPTPIISFAGDTKQTANATVDEIRFTTAGSAPDFSVADVVFWDTTGPAPNNNFLGDVKIETILPNAAGALTQWAVTGSGANFSAVNEVPANDNTSFVSESVVSDTDTYNYQNTTGTIVTCFGVGLNYLASKTDAGAITFASIVRQGGVNFAGVNQFPAVSTFAYFTEILALNPATGLAFTQAELDAIEVGQRITS